MWWWLSSQRVTFSILTGQSTFFVFGLGFPNGFLFWKNIFDLHWFSEQMNCSQEKTTTKQFPLKINANENFKKIKKTVSIENQCKWFSGFFLALRPNPHEHLAENRELLRSGHSRYGNSFPNAKCLFLSGLPPVIAFVSKAIPGVWTGLGMQSPPLGLT